MPHTYTEPYSKLPLHWKSVQVSGRHPAVGYITVALSDLSYLLYARVKYQSLSWLPGSLQCH